LRKVATERRMAEKSAWQSFLLALSLVCVFCVVLVSVPTEALSQENSAAAQAEANRVAIDGNDIGGVVMSSKGPEAGVWVIAETTTLPAKFRKIVVTDDRGRYLIPELPNATYKIWVRGYGLVDSLPVQAKPGRTLALTAVVAPNPQAAAKYYPANYWLSLLQIPPKSAFPMTIPIPKDVGGAGVFGPPRDPTIHNQAEWIGADLKRGCEGCHQMGDLSTRQVPASLGAFDSSSEAWDRMLRSGQMGQAMVNALDFFGHARGLGMFTSWGDRIAKGEVPEAPPRPLGIERNVVISSWDFSGPTAFIHDIVSTNKRSPSANGYGPIYGTDWSAGTLAIVDPRTNANSVLQIPLRDENDRKLLRVWTPPTMTAPSLVWDKEVVVNDPVNPNVPMMDSKGRVWFNVQTRAGNPDYCKTGSKNPFAENFPINAGGKGVDYYDPKTGKFTSIDLCFGTQHVMFGEDKDETLYLAITTAPGGIGWVNTRTWDETGDAEKAQGWCRPIVDYNGDGKTGPYTKVNEPPDPRLDMEIRASGYGIAVNSVDGSVWFSSLGVPGKIVRMVTGANPPATCMTEVYEPPFENAKAPGVEGYYMQGIDIDRNGIVWTALAGSGHLASFDRRKCKVLNGPTATGQQCPEGWTLYPVPGPRFKGDSNATADWFYWNWVDQYNVLGLGANVPVVTGSGSDSLYVFQPGTGKWITMRVPYPLGGYFARGIDGRIDDPKTGWKGRGLWSANESRTSYLTETGKGTPSQLFHFQIRPDPLAK